ncbi:hypothetical protein GCM10022237_46080 [Nocardioides ginsengisoli]|uniref:DUF3558 domain-containing protein n=1 Tax=Nocardioides ginsengisoli TaxID=363868 RepID=A0ABW3W840_9ACTN
MHVRRLTPAALLLLAPVLAACNGKDAASDSPAPSTPASAPSTADSPTPTAASSATSPSSASSATSAPVEVTSAPAAGLPAACDIVTADDVAAAYGVTVGQAEVGGGSTSEGARTWSSDNCSFEAPDLVEVTVKLSGPEDFSKGGFGCPQPSDISGVVEPADDIAGAAHGWWKVSNPPHFKASLRACTTTALLEIDLDYQDGVDYEGDPRNQSAALAERLLAALKRA